MSKQKMVSITGIVCIVLAALLLISLLLPYIRMNREDAKMVMSEPKVEVWDHVTSHDLVRVSLLKFTIFTKYLPIEKEAKTITTVMFIILAVFGALALLFAILKKPVGIIIFDILYVLVALIYSAAFKEAKLMSGEYVYKTGMGHVCIYLFAVLLLIAAIALIVFKSQAKKEANNIEEVPVF